MTRIPEGWKLVPIEPTPEMVEASCKALIFYGRLPGDTPRERHQFKHAMRLRAAIAAAPEPAMHEPEVPL